LTEAAAAARSSPRLGVDFHTFDGIYQGSRSHLLGLYRAAIVQAPDIEFFFFLANPQALRAAHPEFSRPNTHLIAMRDRPGIWRLAWQLASMQRRHRLDLLHVQYRLPFLPQGPCMCTLHDVLFETHPQFFGRSFARVARVSARRAVRQAAIMLTVSEYSRRQIAAHYGIDPERVILTPNAVDRTRFHPGQDGEELLRRWDLRSGEYVCMLGRLEPRKNHVSLVRAYARLGASAPPLLIIGQRDFAYAAVFETIQRLQISERIRIIEDADDEALPTLLRHARLMVYPSHAEGFGMPVLEALASGVPVITSNTTSLPEVAGPAAWLTSPADVDRLAECLREALAETPAARERRIERGLEHAARFTWHEAAKNLIDAVRRAIPRGPQAAGATEIGAPPSSVQRFDDLNT
jgi:glycosyltransferase involved in cell wall biosynthesis